MKCGYSYFFRMKCNISVIEFHFLSGWRQHKNKEKTSCREHSKMMTLIE